jgi:hypothetical protein
MLGFRRAKAFGKWDGKTTWIQDKRAERTWLNVLVWDCDDIEQWLETAPAVDAWFARLLGKFPTGVRDLSNDWLSLSATSKPPLPPGAFLAGRAKAAAELRSALKGSPHEIAVSASSLAELRDFVSPGIFSNRLEINSFQLGNGVEFGEIT